MRGADSFGTEFYPQTGNTEKPTKVVEASTCASGRQCLLEEGRDLKVTTAFSSRYPTHNIYPLYKCSCEHTKQNYKQTTGLQNAVPLMVTRGRQTSICTIGIDVEKTHGRDVIFKQAYIQLNINETNLHFTIIYAKSDKFSRYARVMVLFLLQFPERKACSSLLTQIFRTSRRLCQKQLPNLKLDRNQ